MGEQEYVDMIIAERIEFLLREKPEKNANPTTDKGEQILQELEGEKRFQMEAYMNRFLEISAERETHLYLGGFQDGVRLMLRIGKIGLL